MEAFQLRLWDGRIGRWLSPDPYGEFDSPYLGMGNNPVSTIDPDGGCTKCPKGSPGNPIALETVVIQGKGISPPSIARGFSNFSQQVMASVVGFGNAFGSNMLLGAGRSSAEKWSNSASRKSYIVGQLGGDITSTVWGAGEMLIGGIAMIGGGALVPITGGASSVVAYGGSVLAAHGTSVVIIGTVNTAASARALSDSFAKDKHSSGGGGLGKNAKKMSTDEIESLLGKNWHQNGGKTKFLNQFKKLLKGDINADFYVDKVSQEVFLKSNKSGNWIPTGRYLP
jgi:uncharacterized protein RhaS with RHS repeats